MMMPSPDLPRFPVELYLVMALTYDRGSGNTRRLTIVRLPEVHKGPVEPDLRLAVVHRRESRIERLRAGSRARQDPRVRPDSFDSLVFAHAIHPAHKYVRTQSREYRVHRHPTRQRLSRHTRMNEGDDKRTV